MNKTRSTVRWWENLGGLALIGFILYGVFLVVISKTYKLETTPFLLGLPHVLFLEVIFLAVLVIGIIKNGFVEALRKLVMFLTSLTAGYQLATEVVERLELNKEIADYAGNAGLILGYVIYVFITKQIWHNEDKEK